MDFQPCKTNEGSDASKGEPAIFAGGVESKPSGSDLSKAPPTEISKALTNNPHGTSSPTMRKSRGLFFFSATSASWAWCGSPDSGTTTGSSANGWTLS